jgi:hypothetical protein
MTRFPCKSLTIGFFLALAGSVSAQPANIKVTGSGASYDVEFDTDALHALNDGVLIPRIVVRPGPVRTMLLRPRTSFVNEMLKSVEFM